MERQSEQDLIDAESRKNESISLGTFAIEPIVTHQQPMAPEDRDFFVEKLSSKIEKENQKSVFCMKTMTLVFPEGTIKLTSIEKTICAYIFSDPTVKIFPREEAEMAIYGSYLSASNRFRQAIIRLGSKIKNTIHKPVLSWSEKRIEVLI